MNIDEWKKSRRKKQLDKVNKELEALKRKGVMFEKKGTKKMIHSEEPVKVVKRGYAGLIFSGIIIILLAIGWSTTYISQKGSVDDLSDEKGSLEAQIELKALQIENLSKELSDLEGVIDEKEKSEGELSEEYTDLEELSEIMQERIDDFEDEIIGLSSEISELKGNLTEQKDIVDGYEDCITDHNGPIEQNLNVCEDYID
jgi:hypothetical protein